MENPSAASDLLTTSNFSQTTVETRERVGLPIHTDGKKVSIF